nr:hypothetical protein [Actinopolymorpha alba]
MISPVEKLRTMQGPRLVRDRGIDRSAVPPRMQPPPRGEKLIDLGRGYGLPGSNAQRDAHPGGTRPSTPRAVGEGFPIVLALDGRPGVWQSADRASSENEGQPGCFHGQENNAAPASRVARIDAHVEFEEVAEVRRRRQTGQAYRVHMQGNDTDPGHAVHHVRLGASRKQPANGIRGAGPVEEDHVPPHLGGRGPAKLAGRYGGEGLGLHIPHLRDLCRT